ncbi:MAG: acetate kinase [Acidobacteriota bacterium]|nr:acetate kinase [Acidobacteriota bacterium]
MNILVLNAGSSSLKYELWTDADSSLLTGAVEVGRSAACPSIEAAIGIALGHIDGQRIDAAGHRVVHGGDRYQSSVLIDAGVEKEIEDLSELAPLHNPHALEGIRAVRAMLPEIPQVAVFDTAFHHTLPPRAYTYALPWEYQTIGHIRRYGFHGISHRYVSWRFARLHKRSRKDFRMITCHLGNGCSVCAVDCGLSIDTSMGFTPLEGLVMGTRSGDVDAGAILHLMLHEKISAARVLDALNSNSGLKGISGVSNDMRDVLKAAGEGNDRAALAIDVFCYHAKKYIGAYLAAMNGADALIFTGGIGANSPEIRARICENMNALGISLHQAANESPSQDDRIIGLSRVEVWVVPTNEELLIAHDTLHCVNGTPAEI